MYIPDLENFITKRIEEIMEYIYNNFPYAKEIIKNKNNLSIFY